MGISSDVTLSTIEAMKMMAKDPNKREALVKDGACMGGLVMVLSNQDSNIVATALETLSLLAECSDHRVHMRNFMGMTEQLSALMSRPIQQVQELAKKVYGLLMETPHVADLSTDSFNTSGPLRDTSNQRQAQRDAAHKKQNLFGGKVYKSKTIVLQIKGLQNKEDIEVCKSCLLKVKGLISITFDTHTKRAILRCKSDVKAEALAVAVAKSAGMSAEQVIKDETGSEIFRTFGASSPAADKENRVKMPDYPPSDEDDDTDYSGHPARVGGSRKDSAGGWDYLNKIGSFLSNSFYW